MGPHFLREAMDDSPKEPKIAELPVRNNQWRSMFNRGEPDYVGRWEILNFEPDYPISCPHDSALVLMAGYSAGTNFPVVDGIAEWSGKGIVTVVTPESAKWFGRRTTEGGWYDFAFAGGPPNYGEGTFMIFDRPSNKH